MITKSKFIGALKQYKQYKEYEDKLANLGINIWEREEIQDLVCGYIDLLAYCTKDYHYSRYEPNNIDYFIWDVEFGEKADEFFITEEDGTEVKFHTEEDVWDYLVKQHPEIVDEKDDWDEYDPKVEQASVENFNDIFKGFYE